MWLERLILRRAETRLLPYRKQVGAVPQTIVTQYKQQQTQIETLYAQATHWHGTGRYHYQHQVGSRYQAVETANTVDIFTSILQSNGLIPHHDPWIDSNGNTVSLATTRMHARAFARIHTTGKDELAYELGSIKFWLRLYFALLVIWLLANFWSHRAFMRNLLRMVGTRNIQNWASAIRKPHRGKVISLWDMFKGDIPTSDIPGNYPLLFGIQANTTELIETIPLTHKVEQRSLKPVTLAMFTHVEVPLQKVAETKRVLTTYNIQIPVIPIEFGDIYLADTPLEELAFSG